MLFAITASCSKQKRIEKELAKNLKLNCSDYSAIYTTFTDTVFISDLRKDIKVYGSEIRINKQMIKLNELQVEQCESNKIDCEKNLASVNFSWLAGDYRRLIKDYDKMISEYQEKIAAYNLKNDSLNNEIKLADSMLQSPKDSIAYYKIIHKYLCAGIEKTGKFRVSNDIKIIK